MASSSTVAETWMRQVLATKTVGPRMAGRPIPVDKKAIREMAEHLSKKLLAELKEARQDRPVRDRRVWVQDRMPVRAVDGEERDAIVVVRSGPSDEPGPYVDSGGFGWHRSSGRPVVIVSLNGHYTPAELSKSLRGSPGIIQDMMYKTLLHEVTHAADVHRGEKGYEVGGAGDQYTTDDLDRYYNDPHEVRAFMQQVVDDVEEAFGDHQDRVLDKFGDTRGIKMLLNNSETWREVKPHLREENKRKVLRAVHRNVSERREQTQEKKSEPTEDFWTWLRRTQRRVPNPNPKGREQTITPDTLRGYAEGGEHRDRAQKIVDRYLEVYRKRGPEKGDVKSRGATASWLLVAKPSKQLSRFRQEVEDKRFRNPDTGNEVKFVSLPKREQARIFAEWRRKQRGEEPRKERERGLVEIDKKDARKKAKHIAETISRWNVRDEDEPIGEKFTPGMGRDYITMGTVKIEDVRGREMERPLRLGVGEHNPQLYRSGRYFVTGGRVQTRHVGEDDPGSPMFVRVDLSPKPSYGAFKRAKKRIEDEIYSVLIHEMTHARDVLETPRQQQRQRERHRPPEGSSPKERALAQDRAYYNQPSEVRAFKRQVAEEVRRQLEKRQKAHEFKRELAKKKREKGEEVKPEDPDWIEMDSEAVMELLDRSVTWGRVKRHLNPKNRRKFLESVASVVRKFKEDLGGKVATRRIVAAWMRLAIQKERLKELKLDIPEEKLPFQHIFGDRKRIVVDAPDLRADFPDSDREEITEHLRDRGQLRKGEEVDWEEGVVVGDGGRRTKLGKRIARASAKFEKAHPEAWKALRGSLKARRGLDKALASYSMRVTAPLTDLVDAWQEETDSGSWGLPDLFRAVREVMDEDPDDGRLKKIVLEQKLDKIPHMGDKAQKVWLDAMGEILGAPADVTDKLEKEIREIETERERFSDEARAALERLKEGTSFNRASDLAAVKRANRERDRLFSDRHRMEYALTAFSNWPPEERERFASSIQRATRDVVQADDKLEEAKETYSRESAKLDRQGKIEMGSLQRLERARQKYDRWRSKKDNLAVVVSRAPIDVLRMSDHPTASQKIDSCHKPGKSHFQCAIDEAQGAGLVAYVVDKDQMKGLDPEADELFADVDRGVGGAVPEARIRLRRYEKTDDGSELAVPEHSVYGATYPGLLDFVTKWARDSQSDVFEAKPRLSEYQLTGGTYRDTSDADMFNHFFGTPGRERGNAPHKKKDKEDTPQKRDDEEEGAGASGEFWGWMENTYQEVPNPNPKGRERTIAPSTLRGYAEGGEHRDRARKIVDRYRAVYRKEGLGGKVAARSVVSAWMRRAISQKHVDRLMKKVDTDDLPFDHLFAGKRRMVIDPGEYGGLGASEPDSSDKLKKFMQDNGVLGEGDEVDWRSGLVLDAKGKTKSKIGKAIQKAVKKFAGPDREFVSSMEKVHRGITKTESPARLTLGIGRDNLRALAGMGHLLVKNFPTKKVWEELEKYDSVPSPETWKKLKEVADAFEKLTPEERREKMDEHEREYQAVVDEGKHPSGHPVLHKQMPESYRRQYWDARGLFQTHNKAKRGDEARWMMGHFRKWVDRTNDFYESEDSAPAKKMHELGVKMSPERFEELKGLSEIDKQKQAYDLWRSIRGHDLSVVLSRDPVDVLRMSDHPKAVQAIQSCHSEGGSEFQCAIEEAEEGGMIAYVVKKSDVEGRDLDKGELFEDKNRGVEGIKPFARLRLRRFENDSGSGGLEVAVPETTTYGADFPDFVQAITNWAREEQPEFLRGDAGYSKRPKDWRLTGGTYQDSASSELFNNFFDRDEDDDYSDEPSEDEYDPYGEGYTVDDSPYYDPDQDDSFRYHEEVGEAEVTEKSVDPWRYTDRMTDFWQWMEKNHPKVPNPNRRGTKDSISPSTLKGYARGRAGYSTAARELVGRYLTRYQEERKQYAESRARGDTRAARVTTSTTAS